MFLLIAFAMVGVFTACSDDDDPSSGGEPRVEYIRITDPEASDSLLVTAGQGAMVAIIGENLADAREIWFNDLRGELSPTFITNNTIITRVPSDIPTEINNKITLVFGNGRRLEHDFVVDISEPLLTRMGSEYVPAGEVATIRGNYFYEPITVTFTGGVEGEVVSVSADNRVLEVRVPEGAEPGPVTVTTNFGETESDFWFRDNRNLIATFDAGTEGLWHGPDFIKGSDADIEPINGNFLRINRELAGWAWFETYVGEASSVAGTEFSNLPAAAIANPADYVLKFEINTLAPLTGAHIRMYVGQNMAGERGDINYNWQPNLNTEGEWQTVSIPFSAFWEANNKFGYNPDGYGVSFHFSGPNAVHANYAMDNLRVVPIND
ncbi:hypothetical protein D770_13155 [Flammeovirgaceae bacterium 311]|nr:hypothetical protein D770_13155 [Flammeovirgaceae bacterium 311]